jgi:hypothetical protein
MPTNHPTLARALIDTRERDLAAAAERHRHLTQLDRVAPDGSSERARSSWLRRLWCGTIRRNPQPHGCL